jgi:phage antirepressor YoqD-like protein
MAAYDLIGHSDGGLTITSAAKALQMPPRRLFQWLDRNHWIYRRPGAGAYLGFEVITRKGWLENKVISINKQDGGEPQIYTQVLVTGLGLPKLAELLDAN